MQNQAALPFNSVAFIGFGNMATAISKALLVSGLKTENIHVYGGHQRTKDLVKEYQVVAHEEGDKIEQDLLIVAVKPQVATEILSLYKESVSDKTTIISIMAGYSLAQLKKIFPNNSVVRTMPNMGAEHQLSTTAIYTEDNVKELATGFCETFGQVISLDEEDKMHSFTAVAGSGPAHLFYLMNEMISFTLEQGFTKEQAKQMVVNTAKAAIEVVDKSEQNCGELIDKVASKGGTTEIAITYYQHKNVNEIIKESLVASTRHSLNLAK